MLRQQKTNFAAYLIVNKSHN